MPSLDRFQRFARVARRSTRDTGACYSEKLIQNKDVSLYHAVARQSDDAEIANALRDAFDERAAILEYDGGLDREEAEKIAAHLVRYKF